MAAWIILSFASVEMVKFRDEYHVNRSAKITDMVGQGILTEDEGQQLLEKFSEEKSLTSSPPSTA
jgi:hypothetical protein